MSTRASVHFRTEGYDAHAIVYHHGDGYPKHMIRELRAFLEAIHCISDKRLDDPEYLAAKYIVWASQHYGGASPGSLEFLSIAPCCKDHPDIEFRWILDCQIPKPGEEDIDPKIRYEHVGSCQETGEGVCKGHAVILLTDEEMERNEKLIRKYGGPE